MTARNTPILHLINQLQGGVIMAHSQANRALAVPAEPEVSALSGFDPLREASERWDRAWEALNRRDYAAFDRITGFKGEQS